MPKKTPRTGARPASTKAPSQRMLRVGELIRHKLSDMLVRGEIHDDTLANHVITISEVRMSPDMRLATAYVMPLGGSNAKEVVKTLGGHKRFIRGVIARSAGLQFSPDIRFREDESFEEATRIDRLLDSPKVTQDTRKPKVKPAAADMQFDDAHDADADADGQPTTHPVKDA